MSTNTNEPVELISVEDAIKRASAVGLGMKRTRLYALIAQGAIVAFKDGRRTRIDAGTCDG